jgi:hypothetical protein
MQSQNMTNSNVAMSNHRLKGQAPNARINRAGDNYIVRQVDDDIQADSAPVE